jgi:ribosomal protein L11 methyltransferase
MKPRAWIQILISAPPDIQDELIGSLTLLGCRGFQQEDNALLAFIQQDRWERKAEASLRETLRRLRNQWPAISTSYELRRVRERNWNAAWERSIGILEATDRMIVKPSWRKLRAKDKGKIVLHIDPQMSFGTGHHETTRLCLAMLERYLEPPMRVLDVGTGTGILAIAAAKLGATSVTAIDNDAWSIKNARDNVRKNRVHPRVRVSARGLEHLKPHAFDLIVANIDYPTILSLLPTMVKLLRPQRTLILSGLLVSDMEPLLDTLQAQGVVPMELMNENEWVAVALSNPHAR